MNLNTTELSALYFLVSERIDEISRRPGRENLKPQLPMLEKIEAEIKEELALKRRLRTESSND